MDWSAAVPSWNPSQLPGLVTNRTLLNPASFAKPTEAAPALVFDPIAVKLALIDQIYPKNAERKEKLIAATRVTTLDPTLNDALNVRFSASSRANQFSFQYFDTKHICMEEIHSILSQAAPSSLESAIKSLLVSPDSPGALWVRLLVALCLSPRNEVPRSMYQLIHQWLVQSSLLIAPICILGLHIHRVVVPDLVRIIEVDIPSVNASKGSQLISVISGAIDALEYISAVRPDSVASAVEVLLTSLAKAMKATNQSQREILYPIHALVTILNRPKLFQVCSVSLLNRISILFASEPQFEASTKNFVVNIFGASTEEASVFSSILTDLQNLIVSRCCSLESAALGHLLLLLQRFTTWTIPLSGNVNPSDPILEQLYKELLFSLSGAELNPAKAASFAQLLRGVLETPQVEQTMDPTTFNMLFRWMSLASSVAERQSDQASAFTPIHVNQSDKFVSMMSTVFKSAYPAFYIDKQVLGKLDSARANLTAQEMLNILKNLRLHMEEDLDASPSTPQIRSRELKKKVPLRLVLNAVEVESSDVVDLTKQLLRLAMWVLRECVASCTPMNVYLFLQAALELLLDLLVSKSHPNVSGSDSGSVALNKIEWLLQAISFVAGQNLHLHNVVVAFAVKHLCNPESVTATLYKKHHKQADLISTTASQSNGSIDGGSLDRAPKRQMLHETSAAPLSHKLLPQQRKELSLSTEGCLLQLIVVCLRIGEKDPAERLAVVTEQLLLRVSPPLPAASNEQYAEILPRKPVFERDVAIEHQLSRAPVIMALLQLISSVPMELVRCVDIVKSILALTIGGWNQQVSTLAALQSTTQNASKLPDFRPPATLLSTTQQLWSALSAAQLVPPIMQDIGDAFACCQPSEAVQILMSAWSFIKDNPPVIGLYYPAGGQQLISASGPSPPDIKFERRFNGDVNKPYSNLILFILRKYAHKLSSLLLDKTKLMKK